MNKTYLVHYVPNLYSNISLAAYPVRSWSFITCQSATKNSHVSKILVLKLTFLNQQTKYVVKLSRGPGETRESSKPTVNIAETLVFFKRYTSFVKLDLLFRLFHRNNKNALPQDHRKQLWNIIVQRAQ